MEIKNAKSFYEVMWFSDNNFDEPIIRGINLEEMIDTLLEMIENDSGVIEAYKITYNNLGHKTELVKKFIVFGKIGLCIESEL
jgi:hypothetical protein